MSDSWIIIIPKDPHFVPTVQAQERALDYMKQLVGDADEITAQTTDDVRFMDCGENLERIGCPNCGREVPIEWWQDEMERQYETSYTLEPVRLPCCGGQRSLADLQYDWPQGYARFSVEAMNPGVGDLTDEQVHRFEGLLGCPVTKILQHI